MKLIGIKLQSCDSYIRKSLKENTWYPFGQYQEPTIYNDWTWQIHEQQKNDASCTKMYQVIADDKKEFLDITVNCIVGKNGSGKSSLLDIFYRIINNFSYCLIDKAWNENTRDKNPQRGHYLSFAQGVDATLYFESDNFVGCIHNRYENVYYSYYSDKKDARFENIMIDKNLSKTKIEQITRHFFYSICTNYSIHSLNEIDYEPPRLWIEREGCNIDGKWVEGLFHKNDGYVVPITMVPHREKNGNIDILNENYLAKQRLATLALLFASQGKMFLGVYTPKYIIYRFQQDAGSKYNSRFKLLCNNNFPEITQVGHLRDSIKRCWINIIDAHYKTEISLLNKEVKNAFLMYLTYKTLKTCIHYRKYGAMLGIRNNIKKRKNGFWNEDRSGYVLEYCDEKINKVVEEILLHDTTIHINQKIHQIFYWLKNATYRTDSEAYKSASTVLSGEELKNELSIGWHKKPVDELYTTINAGAKNVVKFRTYDQAFLSMPPSIFEWDITFKREGSSEEECLSQMSSGERQLMHSISYIIYHIKNIESVTEGQYRIRYHNISLVFDEAELYYHPDYQRKFVSNLIKMLSWCHINRNIIRGVNILIVTHSPFVLSDVPLVNTLYLEDGEPVLKEKETFCGNVHELLGGNFFMDYSIGDVARKNVEDIIMFYNRRNDMDAKKENRDIFFAEKDRFKYVASLVADEYFKGVMTKMMNEMSDIYGCVTLDDKIAKAQMELDSLIKQKETEENDKSELQCK